MDDEVFVKGSEIIDEGTTDEAIWYACYTYSFNVWLWLRDLPKSVCQDCKYGHDFDIRSDYFVLMSLKFKVELG